MILSFMFFYLIGAFIFFCHMVIIIIRSSIKLSSWIHLKEKEQEELFMKYFPEVLFQTVMMVVFPVSFAFYTKVNSYYSNTLFIASGVFTIIWLMITGLVIQLVYFFVTHKIKAIKIFDFDKYFHDKEFFWIMCPLLYGILFSFYDHTVLLTIFAIVLGKYIWMDSFRVLSISDIKIRVKEFYTESKSNLLLWFCQAFVMGYLLVRWYPVKEGLINQEYTLVTFLSLAFFLMPILDLLIFKSMKSYAGIIISVRHIDKKE